MKNRLAGGRRGLGHGTFCAGTLVVCFACPSQADVFRDIAFGLGYAGFDIRGNNNPLSGGADFSISNTFVGNELDFGAGDLTLQGPVSLGLSTGGRELSELEFTLRTAVDPSSPALPLGYEFSYDVGGQRTNITGSLFLDAKMTLNGFGFYDLEFQYSSRQTVDNDGRFDNSETDFDFDAGPIRVRGNIFADALAFITEPLFAATGRTNPFESFSNSANLKSLFGGHSQLADALAEGANPTDAELARLASATAVNQVLGGTISNLLATSLTGRNPAELTTRVVPEPTVLLLMLLGLPMVLRHGLRRAKHHSQMQTRRDPP